MASPTQPRRTAERVRRDLAAMVTDGVAFSLMVGLGETFFPAFVLALGIGEAPAGLIASVPMLAGALLQLVSPAAVARLGSYKRWVVGCAIVQGISFIPFVIMAVLDRVPTYLPFVAATVYWAAGLGTGAAWNAWVDELVPRRIRARFFAARSRAAQGAVLVGLVFGGMWLHLSAEAGKRAHPADFLALFAIAMLARAVSVASLSRQYEDVAATASHQVLPVRVLLRKALHEDHALLRYLLVTQTAVFIAASFFTPYMLQSLGLSYGQYMVLISVSMLAKITMASRAGRLIQRFGPHRVLVAGGLAIFPLPALWMLSDNFAYLGLVQIASGVAWATYDLATVLLFFQSIPRGERTSVLSLYNLANATAMATGALCGATLFELLGANRAAYRTLFFVSAVCRGLSLLLVRRVRQPLLRPVAVILRTIALRPASGTVDRPVLPSLDE